MAGIHCMTAFVCQLILLAGGNILGMDIRAGAVLIEEIE